MTFYSLSNLNSGIFSFFPAFEKKMIKSLVKIPWLFDKILVTLSIRLFSLHMTIMNNNLWKLFKVLHEKIHKNQQNYMYFSYNSKSLIHINSNMALLRVRNHLWIIYKNILDNRAKTGAPSMFIWNTLVWFGIMVVSLSNLDVMNFTNLLTRSRVEFPKILLSFQGVF